MYIGIIGHKRFKDLSLEKDVDFWIKEQLVNFKACYKDIVILSGMAKGVDEIAKKDALKEGIPYVCYFPFFRKLTTEEEQIVEESNGIIWCSEKSKGKSSYLDCDRSIIDDSDMLLIIWNGDESNNIYYDIKYAREKGKNIFMYPWRLRNV